MEYIGGIKIEDLDPIGYKVSFYLDRSENPFVLIADLPDEDFLVFIKKELRKAHLPMTKYFGAIKQPPEKPFKCNDERGTNRQNQRSYCGACI